MSERIFVPRLWREVVTPSVIVPLPEKTRTEKILGDVATVAFGVAACLLLGILAGYAIDRMAFFSVARATGLVASSRSRAFEQPEHRIAQLGWVRQVLPGGDERWHLAGEVSDEVPGLRLKREEDEVKFHSGTSWVSAGGQDWYRADSDAGQLVKLLSWLAWVTKRCPVSVVKHVDEEAGIVTIECQGSNVGHDDS